MSIHLTPTHLTPHSSCRPPVFVSCPGRTYFRDLVLSYDVLCKLHGQFLQYQKRVKKKSILGFKIEFEDYFYEHDYNSKYCFRHISVNDIVSLHEQYTSFYVSIDRHVVEMIIS